MSKIRILKTVIAREEPFNMGGILNRALIEILITKQIISYEELANYIRKNKSAIRNFSRRAITTV
jgi:hypothetical protein